jgi:hypothetical protein
MMNRKSYFSLFEWAVITILALAGALINSYLPIKSITEHFGIPGPAAGMALLGGVIFVLWIGLAYRVTRKKYSAIITSVFIAFICLLIQPWYGVVEPAWFSIYAIAALLGMGVIIELTESRPSWLAILGGGLGNLFCLTVTWLAIGFHTGVWTASEFAPFLILGAVVSGSVGALLARGISPLIEWRWFT